MKPITLAYPLGDNPPTAKLYYGQDVIKSLQTLKPQSINTVVTSPPYWGLRDYGHEDQLGMEATPQDFVDKMVEVFQEVRRVLRDDGTVWLNLGDSYNNRTQIRPSSHQPALNDIENPVWAEQSKEGKVRMSNVPGLKEKDLVGIPWMVAFALRADGWYLRSDIIWAKPSGMPEPTKDRPSKGHEYLFLLSKEKTYAYEPIKEPALSGGEKTRRTVWQVNPKPYPGAHFAVFPPDLIEPCILAGCPKGGTVLDPFSGSGTTGMVALRNGRNYVGLDLISEYRGLAESRILGEPPRKSEADEGEFSFHFFGVQAK